MEMGDKIYNLRMQKGYTLEELGNAVGVGKSTVRKWEKGMIANMKRDKIAKLASALDCSPAYLMGWDEESNVSPIQLKRTTKAVTINVLGRVAAGVPIEAVENIIDTEEIPEELARTGEFFGLEIHGDSMEPRMYDGDVVIVRQQEDAENGDIVIAMVNGSDATCKRLMKFAHGISLLSLNSKYEPMMFTNEDIEEKPVKIIGKVVELRGKLKL